MRIFAFLCVFLLIGCVSDYGNERMGDYSASVNREKVAETSPLYKSVSVGKVTGGRAGSYTNGGHIATSRLFKTDKMVKALQIALELRGLAVPEGEIAPYRVDVDIHKADTPALIFNKAVLSSSVTYSLVDNATNEELYATTVDATGEASFKDSFIQPTRIGLAIGYALSKSTNMGVNNLIEDFPAQPDQSDIAPINAPEGESSSL